MKTPPVCNYEESDYQESFWEHGNRAYEDAAEDWKAADSKMVKDVSEGLL